MRHNPFETSYPLEECRKKSKISVLYGKDEKYTKKAQLEGKPYYKWDTNKMAELIYQNGCEDTCKDTEYWHFIATWLSLELKFVDDEKLQYYMNEFYEGRLHYLDEYYDDTIYGSMYKGPSPYVYVLYFKYLQDKGKKMPEYISNLISFYIGYFSGIYDKIPNEDGTKLIEASKEDAEKYNGVWISPEEHEEIQKHLDEKMEEFLRERGIKL